jgi:hypothetical protein
MVGKNFIQSWLFQIALSICLVFFVSCSEEQAYPDKPQIVRVSILPYKRIPTPYGRGVQDSILIKIYVKDGNGDLGINRPVNSADAMRFISNGNWTNYKITILRLNGNKFEPVEPLVNRDVVFFPSLANSKKVKEGHLYFNRTFIYYEKVSMSPTKFLIQIRDNNLNESNVIETDTVIVPYPK